MKNTFKDNKKLRAAVMGVLYYLHEEQENSQPQKNNWARSGREMIMRNRMMVQGRVIRR